MRGPHRAWLAAFLLILLLAGLFVSPSHAQWLVPPGGKQEAPPQAPPPPAVEGAAATPPVEAEQTAPAANIPPPPPPPPLPGEETPAPDAVIPLQEAAPTITTDPKTGEKGFDSGETVEDYEPGEEYSQPLDGSAAPEANQNDEAPVPMTVNAVKLRALNKITAKSEEIEAVIGAVSMFGRLEILARNCWQAPNTQRPENAALLQVWEQKPGEEGKAQVFNGWMFSSSPSLSAMEHPVYDITVIECLKKPMGAGGM